MRELQLAFITNQTTARLFRILNKIERERAFTIGDLAEDIDISQRTIIKDIKNIKSYFAESISLVSGNNGFIFEEKKPSLYQDRKQKLLENEYLFKVIDNIFIGELRKIAELADLYYISESTLRRMLSRCNPILKGYGLRFGGDPLTIEGQEASLRKFFKDFYYEGYETPFTIAPDPELHHLFLNKLSEKSVCCEIGSGTTPSSFYYTLFITIIRVGQGYKVLIPDKLVKLAYQGNSFSFLYSLNLEIERIYGIRLPKEEFAWIYLVTICKRTFDQEYQEQNFYEKFNEGTEISQLTSAFFKEHEVDKEKNKKIKTFLRSFFLSRKINNLISPVLNKEMNDVKETILRSDRQNYEKNLLFLIENKDIFPLAEEYLEDVCVSLTLYSDLILDCYLPPKTIYFLLERDHFICQYIMSRAIQQFGNKHSLTFIPIQYLTKDALNAKNIDLIVTNYNRYILEYITQTDFILLKDVPDENDWEHLEKVINPYRKQLS